MFAYLFGFLVDKWLVGLYIGCDFWTDEVQFNLFRIPQIQYKVTKNIWIWR